MRDHVIQPDALERLVTAAEFRELLRVSARTFRRWRSAGFIERPDVVIGSAERWHLQTVRRVLGQGGSVARPRLAAVGT